MMNERNAVVLWTGGKDCALALHYAHVTGYKIRKLVTFAPPNAKFAAHSLELMRLQAEALELPHEIVSVCEPYKESYQQAMRIWQKCDGIDVLVTGDIDEVAGYPNWVRECAEPLGLEVYTPLWKVDRLALLNEYVNAGLRVMISCVKQPWFTSDWLGRVIDPEAIREMQVKHAETGLDLCGEQGEYHTVVLDGPLFQKAIEVRGIAARADGEIMWAEIELGGLVQSR